MARGRRTTRSTARSQQIVPVIDPPAPPAQVVRTTRSTLQNQQVGRTTRSMVKSQQRRTTAQINVESEHPHPSTQSEPSAHSPVQSEQINVMTHVRSEQANVQSNDTEDDPSYQTPSGQRSSFKTRGATRGMTTASIAKASSSGKLSVIFDAECRQPICTNAEKFNNEIGFIIRNHGTFHYKEWRMVPEEVRAPLRHHLLKYFDINLSDETTKKCIDDQMRKAWKGHKYKLHLYFKRIGGENDVEMAKSKRHPDLKEDQQEDWNILCDRWCSLEFKERAIKNTTNRSKRKWVSKNGSVSTARHHIRRGMVLNSSTGQIETWRLKHYDTEKGWTGPDLELLYNEMMELRAQHLPEDMSDKKIMERVLGRHSVYLRGWGRSSTVTTCTSDHENIVSNQVTNEELLERLNDTTSRLNDANSRLDSTTKQLNVVLDILRHYNLVPPPPTDEDEDEDSDANC
ncbi:hypothetical protein F8388_016598 [Cannabis sativa]|uniref:Transposase, Ptta/En/Spm, plant n=1 Tax=Cannabis sativa TaxID=3483 RepID=A0A7J6F0R5_CANSA|nr:hypothetical protein F8388_016598 [Cannabis sativa]KAF4395761.1 hypothetical protein G4B88_013535 [Cannabis sativa]